MNKYWTLLSFVALTGTIGDLHAQSEDRCALLTQAEATAALGAPAQPGEPAISGCQWGQIGGDGFVQVQVAATGYYQRPPKTAKVVSGIGREAYTYIDLGSPHAMAKTDKYMVAVWASGDKANPEAVIGLLKTLVGRIEKE